MPQCAWTLDRSRPCSRYPDADHVLATCRWLYTASNIYYIYIYILTISYLIKSCRDIFNRINHVNEYMHLMNISVPDMLYANRIILWITILFKFLYFSFRNRFNQSLHIQTFYVVSKGTIIGTIGKRFSSEMEICNMGGSHLFHVTHRIMIGPCPR